MISLLPNFNVKELVDPETYDLYGDYAICLFTPEILISLQGIRDLLDVPIVINNWSVGGEFKYSGYRPKNVNIGAPLSQHKFGNAVDIKVLVMDTQEAYFKIIENQDDYRLRYITRMEDINYTKTWIHIDCKPLRADEKRIKVFIP